jgi:protein-L-isoaspartate(D-aspartate) O-methyltransferase
LSRRRETAIRNPDGAGDAAPFDGVHDMVDIAALRTKMVDGQVRPNDVTDHRIIEAMLEIPREAFVPVDQRELAYIDRNLPVGNGRCLLQPMLVAKMVQAADIQPGDRVLEVGAATGYVSAVASRLAGSVTALESDPALAESARAALAAAGATVAVVGGPLEKGWAADAPFDVILVSGAVETLPDALAAQLADGGRMVFIQGTGLAGRARLHTRTGGEVSGRELFNASAPVLPGFQREPAFVF